MAYKIVAAMFASLLSVSAQADALLSASTYWSIGTSAATSLPDHDSVLDALYLPADIPPASASSSNTLTFDDYSTVWNTNSVAHATTTQLGVSTSFSLTDYDARIDGPLDLGLIDQGADARYRDIFVVDSLSTVYLSPIFDINGTLSATPGIDLGLYMGLVINTVGVGGTTEIYNLIDEAAPVDGSLLPINDHFSPATAYEAAGGSLIQFDLSLSATVGTIELSSLADGASYSALADFDSTSTFLGFAAFEDAEMTIPVTSGVMITSSSTGETIPIITQVVPVPAAMWLFGSGMLCLIGIAGRKKS